MPESQLIFRLCQHHFVFRALDSVYFPAGKAGNVLRGSLGPVLRAFDPKPATRPSGLAEPPRPFVLRASHLDGRRFESGETFFLDVNVFDLRPPLIEMIERAFCELAHTGLGPKRGRVEPMKPAAGAPVEIDLAATKESPERITVLFRTPTELKGNPSPTAQRPLPHAAPFGVLFRRIRDRIGTLRSLYGEGPLPVDFKALSDRADQVQTVSCDLQYRDIPRRSSRTGAVHGIGGFTGTAEYKGELAEFLPYLRAAWWTGAGRHTVWGNGVIEIVAT